MHTGNRTLNLPKGVTYDFYLILVTFVQLISNLGSLVCHFCPWCLPPYLFFCPRGNKSNRAKTKTVHFASFSSKTAKK